MRPTITVKSNRLNSSSQFHPWIFSGAIQSESKNIVEGAIVDVHTEDNFFVGTGYYCNEGSIKVRILTREVQEDKFIWRNLIQKAIDRRNSLGLFANLDVTNGLRLINGEGDDLSGIIVDYYDKNLVVDLQNQGAKQNKDFIIEALNNSSLTFQKILIKGDSSNEEQLFEFRENKIKYYSDPILGQKTGFFLDQRVNRKLLRDNSKNKNILNCFSYSGGFSLSALAGGANRVVSIDSSKRAIELLEKNLALNNLNTSSHEVQCEDVIKYLEGAIDNAFDIIVLDPPAYAKSLRAKDSALRGYSKLNRLGLLKIKKPGILFTFSCSGVVSMSEFQESVFHAARGAKVKCKIIKYLSQAECHPVNIFHPEGSYLKGLMLFVE